MADVDFDPLDFVFDDFTTELVADFDPQDFEFDDYETDDPALLQILGEFYFVFPAYLFTLSGTSERPYEIPSYQRMVESGIRDREADSEPRVRMVEATLRNRVIDIL